MNKVSNKITTSFADSIVRVKNEHKNTAHNWDGPEYDIITDLNNLEDITSNIETFVILELL